MLDLPDLAPWAEIGLRVALVALLAVVAIVAVRTVARVSIRQLLERRLAEGGAGLLPSGELERRVNTIGNIVVRTVGALIAAIAILMALDQFGIDIGPAIAGLGVVGIAVGFGAQTLVRDWLAGVFIVLENQYNIGDVVRLAGVEGEVEDFSLRRTTLRDLEGTVHTVPNGQVIVSSNLTRLWAGVNLDVAVGHGTDLDKATELIDRTAAELADDPAWRDRILEAPRVRRVEALADAGVTLKVLGRVRSAEQWAVSGELRRRLLAAFTAEGGEPGYPLRISSGRVHSDEAAATADARVT